MSNATNGIPVDEFATISAASCIPQDNYNTLRHSPSGSSEILLNDQRSRVTIRTYYEDDTKSTAIKIKDYTSPPAQKGFKDSSTASENMPLIIQKKIKKIYISSKPCDLYTNIGYQSTTTVVKTTKTTTITPEINSKSINNNQDSLLSSGYSTDFCPHECNCIVNCDNDYHNSEAQLATRPLLIVLPELKNIFNEVKNIKTPISNAKKASLSKNSDCYISHASLPMPKSGKLTRINATNKQNISRRLSIKTDDERDTWENKTDFLLSVIGFAVDLANVWRFPYLCFKNGGGAFLIPYVIMVFLAGIPLFYMELALGQYYRKGAITTWGKICPLFKGIGYCVIMTAFYTDFFYNVIIAFALHYFFSSFNTILPWTSCSNDYNSPACYEPSWSSSGSSRECATSPVFINSSAFNSSLRAVSAAEEYFYKYFLGLHEEKSPELHVIYSLDNLGSINWELVACVLIIYLICYFSLWKGIKMSGKVVWFTAIFPYVVLGVLLIRGITLPGWEKGIEYYLRPNIEMLKIPSVWQDAATQVFFSLGPGFGVLLAYSSYNEFHNNVYFDALLTSSINCMTSFLAGFVIFSVLGYMSCKSGKPIHEVAQEGPGLAFVVYPEALATMPGASLWSIAFFLMLLTLGLDSSFGGSEAIITGLSDEFPIIRNNREIFVAVLFVFYMIIGITMCTRGGMLIMEWLIFYGTAWGLLIAVFCETMVISFCYGIKQFSEDIREMLGFSPGWYWKICWSIGAPSFLIAMIISSFINYQNLQYQDYVYSDISNALGFIFALSSASAIPIVAIYTWYKQSGDSYLEKLRHSLIPIKRRRSQLMTSSAVDCENQQDVLALHSHSSDIML